MARIRIWGAVIRGRAEAELRATQCQLDEALRAAKMGFWEYDELTGHVRGSSTIGAVLGLQDGESLQFNRLLSLMSPTDRLQFEGWMANATLASISREIRTQIVRPRDGREAFVHQRLTFQRAASGGTLRITALAWDVTDSAEADQRFRMLFEQAPLGIVLVQQPEGTILDCNHAFADILRRTRSDVIGKTWQYFTHPDDLAKDLKAVESMLQGTLPGYSAEKRYRRKDGTFVWARLMVSSGRVRVTGTTQSWGGGGF
jgi:PAS domain S-box-containing protein